MIDEEITCVGAFQLEAQTRPSQIGPEDSIHGTGHAVKEGALDQYVIVEVLDVAHVRQCTAWMQMQRGSRVSRHRAAHRVAQWGNLKEPRHTAAPSHVRLENIYRFC